MLLHCNNHGKLGGARPAGGKPCQGRQAFSVVELLLAVVIMGIITFALYSVFNQTQRALRSSETQGDISERGRAIMEMVAREIEQAAPTLGPFGFEKDSANKLEFVDRGTNMIARLEYGFKPTVYMDDRIPAGGQPRTNFVYNLLFFSRPTNKWNAIGYKVIGTNGIGTLFRYGNTGKSNVFERFPDPREVILPFYNTSISLNDFSKDNEHFHYLANGVMHFNLIAYDQNGRRLGYDTTNKYPGYVIMRLPAPNVPTYRNDTTNSLEANVLLQRGDPDPRWAKASSFTFRSNALPAYLEMELGLLEPETLKQYQLMVEDGNPNAAGFLTNKINKVHLFRQRIPIRTAVQ